MPEEEYEVESIQQAKVITVGRSRRKEWSYLVKWKNYGMEDNTWEPPSSFVGSEHFINTFWDRVNVGGRDWQDTTQFKTGEEIYPTGPPRRPKPKKTKEVALQHAESSEGSEDEVRSIIGDDDGPKRKRRLSDAPERSSPKRRRGRKSEVQEEDLHVPTPARSTRRNNSVPDLTPTTRHKKSSTAASSKRKPRSSRRSSIDAAAESEPGSQYPSDPYSAGGASRSGAMEPAGSVPSVFGMPLLLQGGDQAKGPAPPTDSGVPLPSHRARAAKPRVQRYEETLLDLGDASGNAIPTKARLMRRNGEQATPQGNKSARTGPIRNGTRSARVSGAKAGPGRSSSGLMGGPLLTAVGGALKSVTRSIIRPRRGMQPPEAEPEEVSSGIDAEGEPDNEAPPPTGEELLNQAGYSATDAQNLSDFEDDVDAHGEPDPDHPQSREEEKMEQVVAEKPETKADAVNGVEHSVTEAPVAREVVGSTFRPWRASIFGPLGLGVEEAPATIQQGERTEDKPEAASPEVPASHLSLNLDYTTSVPVRLKDVYPPASQLESLTSQPNANSPGKFYKREHALTVLQAFRAEGSTARLILDPGADESHRPHFDRFCSRLHAGELFVEMIGVKLLAMYSSENREVGERLGAPANLVGLGETVLVSQVAIENQSAYVDAIAYADNSQWSAS